MTLTNNDSTLVEVWKDIPDFEGYYQISNLGRVKRLKSFILKRNQYKEWSEELPEIIMKVHNDSKGYPQIRLTRPFVKVFRIHRLVALAFLKPPSTKLLALCNYDMTKVLVNHKDQNIENSCYTNLEWCTSSYNNSYKIENKKVVRGSNTYNSILTEDDVKDIIKYLTEKTYSQTKLAELYNVKQITISNIWTGRSWNHITGFKVTPRSTKKDLNKRLSESIFS